MGAIIEMAGGVFANNANALGRQRPPTQRLISNTACHQKCRAGQGTRAG
jgi:hypothetical protein